MSEYYEKVERSLKYAEEWVESKTEDHNGGQLVLGMFPKSIQETRYLEFIPTHPATGPWVERVDGELELPERDIKEIQWYLVESGMPDCYYVYQWDSGRQVFCTGEKIMNTDTVIRYSIINEGVRGE